MTIPQHNYIYRPIITAKQLDQNKKRANRKEKSYQINVRFSHAKSTAKTRKLEWSLSKLDYTILVMKPCTYCNFTEKESGVGLDRIDNRIGYILSNVVPCCGICNIARNILFTSNEMRVIGRAIREIKFIRAGDYIP